MDKDLKFVGLDQFDCAECGRHIIVLLGNKTLAKAHPRHCNACWSLPGWFNDPELAAAIDPYGDRKPPPGKVYQ